MLGVLGGVIFQVEIKVLLVSLRVGLHVLGLAHHLAEAHRVTGGLGVCRLLSDRNMNIISFVPEEMFVRLEDNVYNWVLHYDCVLEVGL